MFTGIVAGTLEVLRIEEKEDFKSIRLHFPEKLAVGLELGASVAINGVCLTVSSLSLPEVSFDVIDETLRVTNLGDLHAGSKVNIERSLQLQDELGGHTVSGHVDGCAEVASIVSSDDNTCIWFTLSPQYLKYVFSKGFISLNGVSLTVGAVDRQKNCFCVYLIPETLRRTTFGNIQEGARVNIEVEKLSQVIVDTIERCTAELSSRQQGQWDDKCLEAYTGLLRKLILESLQQLD